jgi:NAD+ diphosphatase
MRPMRISLRLLPSGPDRVGERHVRSQSPGFLIADRRVVGARANDPLPDLSHSPKLTQNPLLNEIIRISSTKSIQTFRALDPSMAHEIHDLARSINTFANNPLDRMSNFRTDPNWVAARRADPSTLIVPLWDLKPLILPEVEAGDGPDAGWMRADMIDSSMTTGLEIFLGVKNDKAFFAAELAASAKPDTQGPLKDLGEFADLRAVGALLPAGDSAILAQAKAMIDWHARHRHCAVCGEPTHMKEAGYKRECRSCSAEHFPRTDPVVIMLATKDDKALMGRGPIWPEKMFSALAGFVEPGETIEEAVAREVHEETSVRVSNVTYHSTQPWPFPSSLMIGCHAEASTTEIKVDDVELADAQWFDKKDLAEAVEASTKGGRLPGPRDAKVWVPGPMAIAHQLVKAWVEK